MAIDKKYILPFKVVGNSAVTGGYTNVLHTTLGPGTEITNWHRDAYGNLDEATLQSPFTQQWVGGRSHRHVNLNTGSDSAQNRPEAWHLEFTKQKEEIIFNLTEDFNSFSNGEKLSSETYFEGDGNSEVRTRTIDVVGKKYFVFTGTVSRFLKIKNTGPINSLTYTYLVNVQDGITYNFVNGLALEDPDPGEDLELEYSYDNVNWTRKKVIFNGGDSSYPSLREITETVDFSAELPTYVRFLQTNAYDSGYGSEVDNYALTDISVSAGTPAQGAKASFYSHAYRSSPPAYWSRDGLAKRPVNITNIANTDLYAGNYSKGYEYLQTTGRRLTNNLIVDGLIASGSLATQFVTGENNYTLPDLTQTSKTVIVERFNAPGSKEESSRGALDREGEEMSPNIPLPYRNIKMRQPYYHQLAQHMPQFGSGSTYKLLPDVGTTDAVTVHSVNRNRLVRGGVEYFDNWFVQHAIPRTDIQYSWITASATTTAAELGGYQASTGKYAYNDIDFVTSSLVVGGLEVGNLYLDSYVKNTKTVDTTTNTFSIDASLSASFSEYTNSPYNFGTLASTRLVDSPVARALRSNNIISVLNPSKQKQYQSLTGMLVTIPPERGDSSTNFVEPPVTFKYRPLEHRVSTNDDADQAASWFYPYANFFSSYANKSLLEDRLDITDGAVTFYDILKSDFEDGDLFYHGHSYREIIWPKEENTGLKETRQRAEYILDQAGFDRDGYDRQLGTQRAFWRDAQADRQRSLNSEGGYVSSLGYLSTEETGSNFTQQVFARTINNKDLYISASFQNYNNVDKGIFNSITLLENVDQQTNLYNYNSLIIKSRETDIEFTSIVESSNHKNGFIYGTSGEFNNFYNDFYEQIVEQNYKNSLGSLYRNTSYSSLLTSNIENDTNILLLQDDEIFVNPKLKYNAFIGGVELNTGSFIQNNNNFTSSYDKSYALIDGVAYSMVVSGSDIYIGGEFTKIGNIQARRFAKWDGQNWSEVGGGIGNGEIRNLLLVGDEIYVAGNFSKVDPDGLDQDAHNIEVWNTQTQSWTTVSHPLHQNGLNDRIAELLLSGSDIYACGNFTSNSAENKDLRLFAKWDGSNWTEPGGGFTGTSVTSMTLLGSNIYMAGLFTKADPDVANNNVSYVAEYDVASNSIQQVGESQSPFVGISGVSIESSGSDIYVCDPSDTVIGNSHLRKWDGSEWTSPGNYIIPFDNYSVGTGLGADPLWDSPNTIKSPSSTTTEYPEKKFLRLSNTTLANRYLKLRQQLSGTINVSYTAIWSEGPTYDSVVTGIELTHPTSDEDLLLEYSYDELNWNTYETLQTGSVTTGTGLGVKSDSVIVQNLTGPYYLRFKETASTTTYHYALANVVIGNKYFQSAITLNNGAPAGAIIADIKNIDNTLYLGGAFKFESGSISSRNIIKFENNEFYNIDSSFIFDSVVFNFEISGSDIYAFGWFRGFQDISKIAVWNGSEWRGIDQNKEYLTFSNDYFNQTFNYSDFSFSTMDNGLIRTTEADSGKKPFFDSYEDFIADVRGAAKDYSVIPEFRISEHMDYYVKEKGSNFRAENNSIFSLDGVGSNYRSSLVQTGSLSDTFFASYLTSDLLKKEEDVRDEADCELENISLTVSGIKKLLPYNGFYPQDRTVQLANLYGDYVDNKLHGGVYNIKYDIDFNYQKSFSTTTRHSSISALNFDDRVYIASKNDSEVLIHKYEIEDPTLAQANLIQTFSYDYNIKGKIKLVEASNGLNLFFGSLTTSSADESSTGALYHCTSSNGQNWSSPSLLQISGTTDYISGSSGIDQLGCFLDIIVDVVGEEEKIIIVTSGHEYNDGNDNVGIVYNITGTLENNLWSWSEKNVIYTGDSLNQAAGFGISLISCSSGYQTAFGVSTTTPTSGNIYIAQSSDGYLWDTPTIVANGLPASTSGKPSGLSSDIEMIDFENKSFIFFSHNSDYNGIDRNGAVFVVTSSIGNSWPITDTYLDKKVLYYTNIEQDKILGFGADGSSNISVFSGSDSRLYYSFANQAFSNEVVSEYAQGYYKNGVFQSVEDENLLRIIESSLSANMFNTITSVGYTKNEYEIPIFFLDTNFYGEGPAIYGITNNVFTEFGLRVSGSEKYYKHAALEPFFAPGILYNTIKSGISVDWPCATGSNTSIQLYGRDSIVNAYYPQSFQMASYSGSVVQESSYGQLRSNIDYRIPFERLIFPDDAFEAKQYRATDLVEVTPVEALSADSEIVQFIDKNYIYGGYEPYISPVDFSDIDNTGPKRFSVPFVYRKESATDSGLYSLAMSNFLAETVRFFLQDEKMLTFTSDPDIEWPEFSEYTTYYMDVVLTKSPELVTMEAWHSDLHPTGSNGEKMNGRYFGYPVNKTDKALWGSEDFTEEESRLIHNDPAYAPYTPPYFEGEAIVRIAFKPSVTKTYTLKEVLENATIENIFKGVSKGAHPASDAYVNAMPVQSSVNIFGSANPVNVEINEATGERTVVNQIGTEQWIISPYMETPVLDFSDQALTPYQNDYSKTSGHGRGMWSGYGKIPTQGNNINISLRESHPSEVGVVAGYSFSSNEVYIPTGSLLQQVGFTAEPKPIGQIAGTKKISEAVVLIPYVETEIEHETTEILDNYHFITIDRDIFEKTKNREITEATSISGMINTMKKYVIPPQLNFLQHEDIKPFVMYIVEFEHVLDQQDLTDIWQGLMPEISYTAEMDNVSINHTTGKNEFFHGKPLPANLRWMVFKVKKKAEADYFKVTADTSDDDRFNFNKIIGREQGTDIYSYNWPYDFFSLVEFAKVELKLDYKKK